MADVSLQLVIKQVGKELIPEIVQQLKNAEKASQDLKNSVGGLGAIFEKLKAAFGVDFGKAFSAGAKEVQSSALGMGESLGSVGSVLAALGPVGIAVAATLGVLTLGITAATAALVSWTHSMMETSSHLADTSAETGISIEALQQYAHAGSLVGVSQEAIAASVLKASRNIAVGGQNVRGALDQLGLSLNQMRQLSPEQQFDAIAQALRGIADSGRQAAIAKDIFGKDSSILRVLRSDYVGAADDAKRLGMVMSGDMVNAADALGDAITTLEGTWGGLKNAIGAAIATNPELLKAVQMLTEGLGVLAATAVEKIPEMQKAFDALFTATTGQSMKDTLASFEHWVTLLQSVGVLSTQLPNVTNKIPKGDFQKKMEGAPPEQLDLSKSQAEGIHLAEQMAAGDKALAAAEKELATARAGNIQGLDGELAKIQANTQGKIEEVKLSDLDKNSKQQLIGVYQAVGAQLAANAVRNRELKAAEEEAAQHDKARNELLAAQKSVDDLLSQSELKLAEARAASLSPLEQEKQKIQDAADVAVVAAINAGQALRQKALAAGESTAGIDRDTKATIDNINATAAQLTQTAEANDAAKQKATATQMIEEAEKQLAEVTGKLTGSEKERVAAIDAGLAKEQAHVAEMVRTKQITQEQADAYLKLKGAIAEAEKAAVTGFTAWAKKAAEALDNVLNMLNAVAQFPSAFAQATDSANGFSRALGGMNVGKQLGQTLGAGIGAIFGGPAGAALGSAIGKIGGAIIGGIAGIFHKPSWVAVGEQAGRTLGIHVGEEMAKAIEATAKHLKISVDAAALLHLDEAIDQSGRSAASFGDQISHLMSGVASGSIPAKEGVEQIGKAFTRVSDEAAAGMKGAAHEMIEMIQQARAEGLKIPEIAQAVSAALGKAIEGVGAITKNIQIASPQDAEAQAQVFAATFWAKVKEDGVVQAVEAMKPAFDSLTEQLTRSGFDATEVLGPINDMMGLMASETTKGLLDGIGGLQQALSGLADSGYMTQGAFQGLQEQAGAAFDQLVAQGVDSQTALQAIAPLLGQLQQTAAQYGLQLDSNTQSLLNQATAAGVAFPTDPLQQVVDLLGSIATALGATLPQSYQAASAAAQQSAASQSASAQQTAAATQSAGTTIATVFPAAARQAATGFQVAMDSTTNTVDALKDYNSLAAQYIQQSYVAELQEMPIHMNQMYPDLAAGFNVMTEAADPSLQAIAAAIGGINNGLNQIPDNAAAAGSALGGMPTPGGGGGGGGAGGGPAGGGGEGPPGGGLPGYATGALVTSDHAAMLHGSTANPELVGPADAMAQSIGRGLAAQLAAQGTSSPTIVVNVKIPYEPLIRFVEKAERAGAKRTHPDSVQEFG